MFFCVTTCFVSYQQFCNIYRLTTMMIARTRVIEQNPTLYEVTKLDIFQRFPIINLNVYDIFLAYQYCEILRIYWFLQNVMQVK